MLKGSVLNMLPGFGGAGARAGGGGARVGAGAGFPPPPPNKLSKGFAGFAGGAGAGAGASSFSQGHARTTVRRGCRAGANAVAVATMSASRISFVHVPAWKEFSPRVQCVRGLVSVPRPSFQRRVPRFSAFAARTTVLSGSPRAKPLRDDVARFLRSQGDYKR